MTLTPDQLHILQHSLGCDDYGQTTYRGGPSEPYYRNRYVTDADGPDGQTCRTLVAAGLMKDHGTYEIAGGMHCYSVTPEGVAAMKAQSPRPPKLSPAQQRYQDYLDEDCGLPFGEWLKWQGKRRAAQLSI